MDTPTEGVSLPLPCLVCRKPLEPAFRDGGVDGDTHQPSDALMFVAHGNYGSTVYDPMSMHSREYLMVNICDSCVSVAAIDGVVVRAEKIPQPHAVTYTLWTPPGVSDDDDED
jgi:hypothetical protein